MNASISPQVMVGVLSAMLLLGGCLPTAVGPSDARRAATRAAAKPTPAPAAGKSGPTISAPVKGALTPLNKKAIVSSLHNALGATRASRISSTLNAASGVISNNGGGIVSDNGLGYRVQQAAATKPYAYVTETGDLVYYFQYLRPTPMSAKDGTMKIYDKALYKSLPAAEREKALLDHFVWDDIEIDLAYTGKPLEAALSFPMRKVSSKRLPFADAMTTRRIVRGKSLADTNPDTVGWVYEFDLDIALLGTDKDRASFKAVAGEKDIERLPASSGGEQALPVRLAVTGKNSTGTYEGLAEYKDNRVTFTHTATTGEKTRIGFFSSAQGKNRIEVENLDAGLKVIAELDAGAAGTGKVVSTADSQEKEVATLSYTAEGIATINFSDGTKTEARLF